MKKVDDLILLHIEAAQSLLDAKHAKSKDERNKNLNRYADCRTAIEGIHPKKVSAELNTLLAYA